MNSEIIEKLKVEQADLMDKAHRLFLFINSEKKSELLTKKRRELLINQFFVMEKYIKILKSIIDDLGE